MRKKINLEQDLKPKKSLPAIKKSKSVYSPKNLIKPQISPIVSPDYYESKDQDLEGNGNLHVKKIEDPHRKKIKHVSLSTPSFNKKFESSKGFESSRKIVEEESKAKPENFEYMVETFSSSKKKTEIEIKRELSKRNKYKDFELFMSKQKNDEYLGYIDSLLGELTEFKQKNKVISENCAKLSQAVQDSETLLKNTQNLQKVFESKLAQSQKDLAFKEEELKELEETLKKSEEKRRYANEHTLNIESKLTIFQKQIVKLHKQVSELQSQIDQSNKSLVAKESLINDLNTQIFDYKAEIEKLKLDSSRDLLEYDKVKKIMQGQIDLLSVRLEKLEGENENLNDNLLEAQNTIKRAPTNVQLIRRSETINDSKFLTGITKEEASRWHSRYFSLEQELNLCREHMEKLQKNENYYKTQIEQKNLMIQRMEFIIENSEKCQEKEVIVETSPKNLSPDVSSLVEIFIGKVKSVEENFKCENCFKFSKNNEICLPCLHLACDKCRDECVGICGLCAEKSEKMVRFDKLNKLAEFYSSHLEELEKLKELLVSPCF